MKAPVSLRIWLVLMGSILWTGIYFTGFSKVSWLLYLPAAAFTIAGIIGICPTQIAIFKLFDARQRKTFSKN